MRSLDIRCDLGFKVFKVFKVLFLKVMGQG